jgi:hypothetical protein
MHSRLVEHGVRELGEAILSILYPTMALYILAIVFVRLPEHRLVDPAGFVQYFFDKAKGIEHPNAAASDTVGLAELDGAGLLLDDTGLDVGEGRELSSQGQAGRAAADDQYIDLRRQCVGIGRLAISRENLGLPV